MATHGTVSKFQPNKEDWSTYVEQLTFYFTTNGVTEDKQQRSILLANCGTATFKLIKSLLEEGKIQTAPFKDLVALHGAEPLRTETVGDRSALQI